MAVTGSQQTWGEKAALNRKKKRKSGRVSRPVTSDPRRSGRVPTEPGLDTVGHGWTPLDGWLDGWTPQRPVSIRRVTTARRAAISQAQRHRSL